MTFKDLVNKCDKFAFVISDEYGVEYELCVEDIEITENNDGEKKLTMFFSEYSPEEDIEEENA
jgi:hypothetical protein